jgi:hypothetical protein
MSDDKMYSDARKAFDEAAAELREKMMTSPLAKLADAEREIGDLRQQLATAHADSAVLVDALTRVRDALQLGADAVDKGTISYGKTAVAFMRKVLSTEFTALASPSPRAAQYQAVVEAAINWRDDQNRPCPHPEAQTESICFACHERSRALYDALIAAIDTLAPAQAVRR